MDCFLSVSLLFLATWHFSIFFLPHNSWTSFQIVISFKHLLSHPWCWAWLLSSILAVSSPLKARLYTFKHWQVSVLLPFLSAPQQAFHIVIKHNCAYKLWFFFTFTFGNHPTPSPSPPSCKLTACGKKKKKSHYFYRPWITGFAEVVPAKVKKFVVQKWICAVDAGTFSCGSALPDLLFVQTQWVPAPGAQTSAAWCKGNL